MSATVDLKSPLLRAVTKALAGFVAIAAVITHMSVGAGPFFWGILAAGALQLANLAALTWFAGRLVRAERRGAASYAALFILKIGALLGAALWALQTLPVDPFGFMIGVALLIPAALYATVTQPLSTPSDPVEVEA